MGMVTLFVAPLCLLCLLSMTQRAHGPKVRRWREPRTQTEFFAVQDMKLRAGGFCVVFEVWTLGDWNDDIALACLDSWLSCYLFFPAEVVPALKQYILGAGMHDILHSL